jgi:hypothetical protein
MSIPTSQKTNRRLEHWYRMAGLDPDLDAIDAKPLAPLPIKTVDGGLPAIGLHFRIDATF